MSAKAQLALCPQWVLFAGLDDLQEPIGLL
jgi:hypothetical protein